MSQDDVNMLKRALEDARLTAEDAYMATLRFLSGGIELAKRRIEELKKKGDKDEGGV